MYLNWVFRSIKSSFERKKKQIYSIDKCDIYFINLDHREDRRKEITEEFRKLNLSNFRRISAFKNSNGALGCAMSHKYVYELSLESENLIMVCEDDISFLLSRAELDNLINSFYNNSKLDVLCLAYNSLYNIEINKDFNISSNIQTMACYILKPNILNEFIDMANVSIDALDSGNSEENYAIDQVWKRLQKKFIFAFPKNRVVVQRPSYSDIRNVNVDYKV